MPERSTCTQLSVIRRPKPRRSAESSAGSGAGRPAPAPGGPNRKARVVDPGLICDGRRLYGAVTTWSAGGAWTETATSYLTSRVIPNVPRVADAIEKPNLAGR